MRTIAHVLALLAIACGTFSYWGLSTDAGRRAFDEMAGIVPAAAGAAAAVLAVSASIAWWLDARRRARRDRNVAHRRP